ncbi:hypothetical protein Fmac_009818 [Flemingia macrophylla]|uniref:Uncharacterized protein n=1 Tax=Flemingia macrophylla TaxID=520843 RepID=A0ABD1N199_9FABA
METFDCVNTTKTHSHIITDIRFRTNSTIFATSSFDRSVRLWDATKPTISPAILTGHTEQVMSLDFHPRKIDLLCSCDNNDVIRLWDINQRVCTHTTKGGSKQVRFQPCFGELLATATGKNIKIYDVETNSLLYNLETLELWSPGENNKTLVVPAHKGLIVGLADSPEGELVASASHDHCVKLWK